MSKAIFKDGRLNTPLKTENPWNIIDRKRRARAIKARDAELLDKIIALGEHYAIKDSPATEIFYGRLALCLAKDFVKGFQEPARKGAPIRNIKGRPKSPGRPVKWDPKLLALIESRRIEITTQHSAKGEMLSGRRALKLAMKTFMPRRAEYRLDSDVKLLEKPLQRFRVDKTPQK